MYTCSLTLGEGGTQRQGFRGLFTSRPSRLRPRPMKNHLRNARWAELSNNPGCPLDAHMCICTHMLTLTLKYAHTFTYACTHTIQKKERHLKRFKGRIPIGSLCGIPGFRGRPAPIFLVVGTRQGRVTLETFNHRMTEISWR